MRGFYFLLVLLIFSGSIWAQSVPERKCAAQILHNQQLESNPSYKSRYEKIQKSTKEFQERQKFLRSAASTTVREIPVYVHIIYDEAVPEQNLSDAQIESQIEVLNNDFRALNADISDVPSEFAGLVADYQLIFTLEGIARKSSTVSEWIPIDNEMKSVATGGIDPITPETHLNIWVCNLSGSTLGFAQFPGGSLATDGVVVGPQFFGSSDYDNDSTNPFYLSSPYDKGRTTTHEIGHYLNLFHIWGDGGCTVDDEVADTPIAAEANEGCPAYPSKSCTVENTEYTSDMFMNYMDYSNDACMFMFSKGQKTRSYALFEPGGFRDNLGEVLEECGLAAPSNLSLISRTTTSLSLNWDAVTDANSYDVWANGIITNSTTNSIELTALEEGNTYEIKVVAKCADGGSGIYSDISSFNTLGCFSGPLELSITTDDWGSETSWAVSLNGEVIQTDSITYENNTIYTEIFDFEDGNYKFEIFDSENDGICCDFGEGSYSLVDNDGRIIKSGGDFKSSESVNFCVETSETIDCELATLASVGNNNVDATPKTFEFEATEDREYIISSVGSTSVNTDLSIYSDCSTKLAENDDFDGTQSEIKTVLEAGQIIFIQWKDTHSTAGFDWSISGGKFIQSISFSDIEEKKINDEPFELTGSASSGLEVSYTSSNPDVATISGNMVTIVGAGQTSIIASQSGNEEYLAAPNVQKVFTVNKLDQSINFTKIPDKFTTDLDFEIEAEASSGLDLSYQISGPATISGTTISLDGSVGTVSLTAIQAGNDEYESATNSISFEVREDPCVDFVVSEVITNDISCAGENDGSIEVMVSGGETPMKYSLNGGSEIESNLWEGLSAGEYSITITDDNNCIITATTTIKSPNVIDLSAEVSNSTSIFGNGSIELTVTGGTGTYSYEWSNDADTAFIEDLEAGVYSVIVTDENGCSIEDSFEVGGVTSADKELDNDLLIYPNPVQDYLRIIHPKNAEKVFIYNTKGKLILEKNVKGDESEINLKELPTGLYFIKMLSDSKYYRFVKE